MRDPRKDAKTSDRGPGSAASAKSAKRDGDAKSERLAKLARSVGNDEIKKRIRGNTASRDMMLAHMCKRLRNMHELHRRERMLTLKGAHYRWWRKVADPGKRDQTKPEPARWGVAARAYELAANTLCKGDLTRGRQQLERAMNLEDQVRSQMTDLVQTEGLEESVAPDRQWMHDLVQGGRAGVRDLPEDIRLAWEIQNVNTEIRDIPNRRRPRDPWWTEEEEEEEEEGGDDAGSG